MLEKIKHNLGIKIIAVVLAVLIWFVVYINDNPIETRYINIPVSVLNEDSLAKDNLRVLNDYSTEIEIFVRGRKADVDSVTEKDFIAYLDFSEVKDKSTEYLEVTDLTYLGDRNVSSGFTGSGRIGVNIDRIVIGEVPITVNLNGVPAEGFSVVGTVLKPANYTTTDIESLVRKVDSAVVEIDVNELRGTETIRKPCVVYDEFGNVINELSNKIYIDVTINIAKTIPVAVVTSGIPETDHLMTKIEAQPREVLITGSEEDLSKINSISTLPISLNGATETFLVSVGLASSPSGTALVGTGSVDVEISIEALYEKVIAIDVDDITVRWGTPSQKAYKIIDNDYNVTIKGRQSILDVVNVNSLTPYIDVSTAMDGQSSLPLRFQSLGSLEQVSFPLIEVFIESKTSIEADTSLITI
ncbi:MAG: hypothetical protein JXN10_11575, partial [Clostridia bacterium]|nr:hypothetical protein [Clostridia bacterium]